MQAKRIVVEHCTPFWGFESLLESSGECVLISRMRLKKYPKVSVVSFRVSLIYTNLTDFPVAVIVLLGEAEQI